jgi:hypothetical protein
VAQVKDPTWPEDYGKVIGAEKIEGHWQFYYASYAVLIFRRRDNGGRPHSLADLSRLSRKELTVDGFVRCGFPCNINYDFVDGDLWFADWRRNWHQDFLRNALPREPMTASGKHFY